MPTTFNKHSIELAYSFFHQKQRVYQYSNMDWQKDDIEYAIGDYVNNMPQDLYNHISGGNPEFLRSHVSFGNDLIKAVEILEGLL